MRQKREFAVNMDAEIANYLTKLNFLIFTKERDVLEFVLPADEYRL